MKSFVAVLLVTAGLINSLPVAGVLSAELLASAYGITAPEGLVSMLGFFAFAFASDEYGAELRKVVIMDVIAMVALGAAAGSGQSRRPSAYLLGFPY